MTDKLSDTFGEDFAEQVQEKIQERRAERERVSEENLRTISHLARNEEKFKDGDPQFQYTTDEGITHTALLMQLAEPRNGSVWNEVNRLDSGAISLPLNYLDEWVWSIFNEEQMARKMEEGEWYLVVGNLTTWEPDDGPPQDQLSPVRAVLSMDEVQELADEYIEEEEGFTGDQDQEEEEAEPEPEPEPEQETEEEDDTEEEESDSDSGGIFDGEDGDDEEEEEEDDEEPAASVTYTEVANIVEGLAEEEDEMWELHADHDELQTVAMVVMDKLDGVQYDHMEERKEVIDMVLDRVDEGPAGEEEEEEDEAPEEDNLFSA